MSTVAAVIVTFNRRKLLLECLDAVRDQQAPVGAIFLVDNASTDGSQEALAAAGWTTDQRLKIDVMPRNLGGAGGFAHGMSRAFAAGHDWIWVMDDDCLPRPDALSRLLEAEASFPREIAPQILSSRVEWTDGLVHPLNVIAVAGMDKDFMYACVARQTLSIRAATFVSLLARRDVIARHGYPLAAYFLWLDDVEWTARVLRHERGVLVPASVVVHRTATRGSTLDAPNARYYLYVRNSLWMLLGSRCFSPREKCFRMLVFGYVNICWLRTRWWRPSAWFTILRGALRGLVPPAAATPSSIAQETGR